MTQATGFHKIGELIRDIEIAMLTTICEDGSLHSRPMASRNESFEGDLWFFSRDDTPKTNELVHHREVNIAFADPTHQRYVSCSGTGAIVRDRSKAEELWNPVLRAWFKNGLDDPHLVLIRVKVGHAEYWEGPSTAVTRLVGLARKFLTGEEAKLGDNQRIAVGE